LDADKENELVQYYIVNKDLCMSTGKIAAQTAHASRLIALRDQNDEVYKEWLSIMMKTIVLEGSEKRLLKLLETYSEAIGIRDNGLTEIPANSLTVVVLPAMKRVDAKQYVKGLQVLKDK
jgi:peptidyl-tRNA hydrolase